MDDTTDFTDTSTDPSTETESEELEPVSEDDQTPTDSTDDSEATEDVEEDELVDPKVPYHKIPRFRELNDKVKTLEAKLAAKESSDAEAKRLANATPQERAVAELFNNYGVAPKSEVEKVKKDFAAYKDAQDFEKFLTKYPEAAPRAAALKALAFTPFYGKTSYEDIYKEVFSEPQADPNRKVVARRLKTGMKPLSAGGSKGEVEKVPTRADIDAMDDAEFDKNRSKIQKWMAEGKIK